MTSKHPSLPPSHIPALDGIRAVAVFAVIGYHGGWPGFSWGGFGVDLFFVLSGFLITWLLIKEREKFGQISLNRFYTRRILRIVPAYFFFLAGYAALCALVFRDLYTRLLESTLYAATYTTNVAFSWLDRDVLQAHTWSLSMEEQFYLAYPALIVFSSRRTTLCVTVLMLAIAPIWRVVLLQFGADASNPLRIGYGPDTRFDSILWGSLLAHVWTSKHLQRLKTSWATPVFIIGALLTLGAIQLSLQIRPFMVTFGYSFVGVGSMLIILALLMDTKSHISNVLTWKPLRVIGVLSYSMYLWHPAILGLASRVRTRVSGEWEWLADVFYVSGTFAVSTFSYWFVERRFLRIKNVGALSSLNCPIRRACTIMTKLATQRIS